LPEFTYKALTRQGQPTPGLIRADDRAAAVSQLADHGSFVTDLEPASNTSEAGSGFLGRGTVKPRQRVALLRQLSVGLSAGLPLVAALQVVSEQAENPATAALIQDLVERVTQGDALSDAMLHHPAVFSTMQVSMTRAGETAGALDEIMVSLSDFSQRDLELQEKLRSAAIYPLMVVAMGLLSILVIVLFILPRIMSMVEESGSVLPLPTRLLMGVTTTLRSPMGIVIALALAVGVAAFLKWSRTPQGRLSLDTLKLRLPLVGTAVRRVAVSRFARTLGTLSAANIPIVDSMRIVRDTLGNQALAHHLDQATQGIVRGNAIADELNDQGHTTRRGKPWNPMQVSRVLKRAA